MTTPNPIRAALERLQEYDDADPYHDASAILTAARAALAAAPEGEVEELVAALRSASDGASAMGWERDSWVITRAADLLSQRHPAPVPVSERLPGAEDCDAEGRVWVGHWNDVDGDAVFSWELDRPSGYTWKGISTMVAWLPAHALPLPAPQGGEGEG